jgi:hypothetical protein
MRFVAQSLTHGERGNRINRDQEGIQVRHIFYTAKLKRKKAQYGGERGEPVPAKSNG